MSHWFGIPHDPSEWVGYGATLLGWGGNQGTSNLPVETGGGGGGGVIDTGGGQMPANGCQPKKICARLVNGRWVYYYPKHRRRKRLATASEIGDLASLKAVLTGKQLETWIARRC